MAFLNFIKGIFSPFLPSTGTLISPPPPRPYKWLYEEEKIPKADKNPKVDKKRSAKAIKAISKKMKKGRVVSIKGKKFVVAGVQRKKPVLMPYAVFKRSKLSKSIRLSSASPMVVREVEYRDSSNGFFDFMLMNYMFNNTVITPSTSLSDAEARTSLDDINDAHVSESEAAQNIEDETISSGDSYEDSSSYDSGSDSGGYDIGSSDSGGGDSGGGDGGGGGD